MNELSKHLKDDEGSRTESKPANTCGAHEEKSRRPRLGRPPEHGPRAAGAGGRDAGDGARANTGRAAVFVGGTDLAGVNLELAGAICFLSTTPSKGCAEQFAGRVFRKGNPHTEVEVVVFYSKGTEEEGEANKFLGELNTIISSLSSNSPHF